MIRQIILLSKIQICNLFSLNEIRYTTDTKKKNRNVALSFVWAILLIMLISYISMASIGLVKIGLGDAIPILLYVSTSMIILCFTFLKAGSTIFQMNSFEILISFPVTGAAIVVSRFFTMYITNLALSIIVMLPGTVIYGVCLNPGAVFYLTMIIGMIFLPMIPITIATAIGAAITAISSRMRHKSLVSAALSIILAVGVIVGSMALPSEDSNIDINALKDMTALLMAQIKNTYFPAFWFGDAAINGNLISLILLVLVSLLFFIVMVAVLQSRFLNICSALNATSAKNNYKMQKLNTNSVITALWKRELKRYFASSIYVTNTLIGYILMAAAGVSLLFFSVEQVETALQMPHIIRRTFPLFIGMIGNLMPTTSSAISMEGKQWWIAQTLPIRMKDILWSKVFVNLTIAAPFYLVAVIAGCIGLRPGLIEGIWFFVIPAVYTVFSSIVGLTVNLALPILDWDNEARVVKQSASSFVSMLVSVVTLVPFVVLVLVLQNEFFNIIMVATCLIFIILSIVLIKINSKKNIIDIG